MTAQTRSRARTGAPRTTARELPITSIQSPPEDHRADWRARTQELDGTEGEEQGHPGAATTGADDLNRLPNEKSTLHA